MTGSLQQKNGKYYAVINFESNGKRKQKWIATEYQVKGNKRKAEQFLKDKLKEYEEKNYNIDSEVLFSKYVKHWLSVVKIRIDSITLQGYVLVANRHVIPYFEQRKIKLCDVNLAVIQDYINSMYENGRVDGKGGLSPKTLRMHLIVIRQTILEAIRNDLIHYNPCEYVILPPLQRLDYKFFTAEQLNKFFELIKDEQLYPLIKVTALYGLRRSEVLGLKWDSINFDMNTLTIKHTVAVLSSVVEKDKTKTKSSYRTFPLTCEVKKILLELKEKEETNRKLYAPSYVENDYIFKWDNGKPYRTDYITKKFTKLLKQYDFPHIRFHDLRHSCASLLIANGFTLKDVQEWLGHSDIQVTANIYAHLDMTRKNNIASSIQNILHE